MPNPYGITEVDVPGIIGAWDTRRQGRMREMMAQRQMDRQDRQDKDDDIQTQLTRHRERFVTGARLLEGVNDAESYARARQAMVQSGMDVSDVPTGFDPAYVDAVRRIGRAFSPQSQGDGFTLGTGQTRFDAQGRPIARGAPERPRYYSVPQGGDLRLDPSYQGPTTETPAAAQEYENPQTGQRIRLNPQTNQWEPVTQGGAGQPQAPATFP